ncbi:MAG: hypothetical protein AAF629_28685 [Chloroflexota bacterium]
MADFEISGELEITCKPELNAILTTGTNNFMSLFAATAVQVDDSGRCFQGAAILVNKSAISYMGLK